MKNKILTITKRVRRKKSQKPAGEPASRITNETVAEHREEVLSSARKYVYPLSHSKHRIVQLSIIVFITAIVAFFAYCGLALYKFQSTSSFVYGVSRVIPFPVAKAGSDYVSYESYLFELRRYMHYYQTQQSVNFSSDSGKQQLANFKKQALRQVIDYAYIKRLADQKHISVSNQEVDNELRLVREQNRLGGNDQVFRDVLQEFWGWSVGDFKRELRQQLLAQKVVVALDTATQTRAQNVLQKLHKGADFGKLAARVSDDKSTKLAGGEYGITIDKSNRDIAPQVTEELFRLKPKQVSDVINTGYSLEIVKVISRTGDKIKAAHISFNFKGVDTYLQSLKTKEPSHKYIKV